MVKAIQLTSAKILYRHKRVDDVQQCLLSFSAFPAAVMFSNLRTYVEKYHAHSNTIKTPLYNEMRGERLCLNACNRYELATVMLDVSCCPIIPQSSGDLRLVLFDASRHLDL